MSMSLMGKYFSVGACVLLLSACASAPSNKIGYYQLSNDVVNVDGLPKKYKLENFELTLNQKANNPDYPDEQALKAMFVEKLNQELVSQNKLAQSNGMAVDISMQYQRIFEGEAFGYSKIYATNRCAYTATLSFNGKQVASFNDDATRASLIDEQKSLLQNLKKVAEMTTLSGDQESEERDINTCAQRIVERLPK